MVPALKRIKLSLLVFTVILSSSLYKAQPPLFRVYDYIERFSPEAVHQMAKYKIPASVILAQAIFESASGTSQLAKRSNNHFGIKCHNSWSGDTITKTDDAYNECFRKYRTIEESYNDHSIFLATRPWYKPLFKIPITDYKSWCYGLKNAGYATYSTYAEELIRIIEKYQLYKLDQPERLNHQCYITKVKREIVPAHFNSDYFNMHDYARAGALWLDEKNVLIQSLELIVNNEEELDLVAEK
jgi:hypothetical protein